MFIFRDKFLNVHRVIFSLSASYLSGIHQYFFGGNSIPLDFSSTAFFFSFYIFVISMALLEGEVEKTLIPFVNFLNPEVFLVFGNNGNLDFPLI